MVEVRRIEGKQLTPLTVNVGMEVDGTAEGLAVGEALGSAVGVVLGDAVDTAPQNLPLQLPSQFAAFWLHHGDATGTKIECEWVKLAKN